MISLLSRFFIKDRKNFSSPSVRNAYGVLCGAVGIFLNILLSVIKLIASSVSGSISIAADAVNNLSDAASSLVTLVGFRLAGQKPDHSHPFGHGRIEYISGLVVSMIIMFMGFELGKSSVSRISSGTKTEFSFVAVVILAVSLPIKLYMCYYNKSVAKKISSTAMSATAIDCLCDCVATSVILICTVASLFTGVQLDGWCGIVVSLFIFYSGINSAKETINPLLGTPPDKEFVEKIKNIVLSYDEISGVHDLVVHNYGPNISMISLHAEVSQTVDILQIHDTIDNVEHRLSTELNCDAVIHMDPIATNDKLTVATKEKVLELARALDQSITIHDFRMVIGQTHTNLIFDMVIPYNFRLRDEEIKEEMSRLVKIISPEYRVVINIDKEFH